MKKEYMLLNPLGEVLSHVLTRRPSGPVLSNADWHAGKQWLPVELVPKESMDEYFRSNPGGPLTDNFPN